MKVCAFIGPTLARAEAEAILPAIYLPPARRGDILAAVEAHAPDAIALIDGYFEQVPAVWHKELLWALDRNVALYGAASMGALRAAELAQFGMVGIGKVFEAYRSGCFDPFSDAFEDDDEVAVVHGPAEIGYAASDAMVDIRATLSAAHAAGVIDAAALSRVAGIAKRLFYKRRVWPTILKLSRDAGFAGVGRLERWLPDNRVLQKRLDAVELLRHLAGGGVSGAVPSFRFERTLLWEDARAARALKESG